MKNKILLFLSFFVSLNFVFGEAAYVYHEQTNAAHCGGIPYMDITAPNQTQPVQIAFKINFQFYWNEARIYYTTDGSTPSGAFGTGSGSSQVLSATYQCGANPGGGIEEIVRATIPAQSAGTTVKYIVAAWHSGGGDEIFGNGCGDGCPSENTPASAATVFQYTVALLPVELVNFDAKKSDNQVELNWNTASEKQNSHFDVQRSVDSKNWQSLGKVEGRGTTLLSQAYSFLDRQPLIGKNYYRLEQVDFNGKKEFSKTVSVDLKSDAQFTLSPNPVESEIFVRVPSANEENFTVQVFNLNGQLIASQNFQTGETIDVSSLPPGMYLIRLKSESRQVLLTERFVKN